MGDGQNAPTIDLLRWTFTADPDQAAGIEEHLIDMGLDVLVREDSSFTVTWDEPEGNVDAVVEAIWALNGQPFEITQEEFRRTTMVTVHHEDDGTQKQSAA